MQLWLLLCEILEKSQHPQLYRMFGSADEAVLYGRESWAKAVKTEEKGVLISQMYAVLCDAKEDYSGNSI